MNTFKPTSRNSNKDCESKVYCTTNTTEKTTKDM